MNGLNGGGHDRGFISSKAVGAAGAAAGGASGAALGMGGIGAAAKALVTAMLATMTRAIKISFIDSRRKPPASNSRPPRSTTLYSLSARDQLCGCYHHYSQAQFLFFLFTS